MIKIKLGRIYKLDLDNCLGWMDTEHKEKAYRNCHWQLARLTGRDFREQPTKCVYVQMLSGPEKNRTILIAKNWFSKLAKILCDCPLLVVLNRGCQNTENHE